MALSRDIVLRLLGDSSSATKALKDAAQAAGVTTTAYRAAEREQAKQTAAMQKASAAQSAAHRQIGIAAVAMGAAVGLGLGLAVRAAVNWESAFAGVAKTVEGTPEQMNALSESLRGLALILPVSAVEIAAVAEAAGQLGIARQDLVAFTSTAVALGETTNLSAQDAATGLAQLSNVMGTSADDTDRLGSALVELGNNGASTEADILAMAQRIAGAGQQIGLTEGEVLGFAAALANVGIEAEAGGTAISKVMIDIASSVEMGGEKLELFAQVAGMSVTEFSNLFETDAASAVSAFVTGLGKIDEAGGSTFQTLEQLGLSEVRVRDALLRVSAGADGLTSSLQVGNQAWEQNSALLEEAARRYATTESQIALARNALTDAAIDIGNTLIPVLLTLGQVLQGLIGFWQALPGPVQAVVVALAAVAAVGATLGGGLTVAKAAMSNFALAADAAGGSVSRFGKAGAGALAFVGGPWGIALGVAALGIGALAQASAESESRIRELTAAIEADSGALGDNTRLVLVNQLGKEGLLEAASELGINTKDLVDAMLGEADALGRVNEALDGVVVPARLFEQAMTDEQLAASNLTDALGGTNGELTEAQEAYRLQQEALGGSTAATEGATAATGEHTEVVSADAAATETMAEAADKLKEALDALTGAFVGTLEASSNYEESLDSVDQALIDMGVAALDANGNLVNLGAVALTASGQIDVSSEAGRRLQGEFLGMRDAGNEVIDSLVRQGNTQGALAADQRLYNDFIAKAAAAGIFGQEAIDLANSILGIPEERRVEISTNANEAAAAVRSFGAELAALQDQSVRITTSYISQYSTDYLSQGAGGGLAYGGQVGGYSPNPRADNIPIMATAGEFMQPVDAVQYYGPAFMEAIRTKSFPRYADGGPIGSQGFTPPGMVAPVFYVTAVVAGTEVILDVVKVAMGADKARTRLNARSRQAVSL